MRVFADKALGYGIPGITIDGTDADEIAAAFAWAAERARAGAGPALIELVSMRMCGHAHHDDMLYLGKDAPASWDYPPLAAQRLRQPRSLCVLVGARSDRAVRGAARRRGLIAAGDRARIAREAEAGWSSARRGR